MRKSRFSEEQIVRILQEYSAWAKVSELCRKQGMSDETLELSEGSAPALIACSAE